MISYEYRVSGEEARDEENRLRKGRKEKGLYLWVMYEGAIPAVGWQITGGSVL